MSNQPRPDLDSGPPRGTQRYGLLRVAAVGNFVPEIRARQREHAPHSIPPARSNAHGNTLQPRRRRQEHDLSALAGNLALVEDVFRTVKAPVLAPEEGTLRERIVGLLEQIRAWSRSRPTRRTWRHSSRRPSATRRCATCTAASVPNGR
jgi:hypothetical protein